MNAFSTTLHDIRAPAGHFTPRPAGLLTVCRQMAQNLLNPYRPERHYMRGPGPAWCRKHGVKLPLSAARRS